MSTTLHFRDLKKQQNLICLVNIRMSVPFRIATFAIFNHFIPHCFVLCVTNCSFISKPLLKKHVIINTRLSNLWLPFDLFYLIVMYADKNHLSHIISSHHSHVN